VGPLLASVEPINAADDELRCRVTLSDGGDDRKPVAFVSLTLDPL
jgi:hypothetical protein